MYAERFAPEHSDSEEEAAHAFELRPSTNLRILARERLAASPRWKRPVLKKNASVRCHVCRQTCFSDKMNNHPRETE